jgi:hypothetical protein
MGDEDGRAPALIAPVNLDAIRALERGHEPDATEVPPS